MRLYGAPLPPPAALLFVLPLAKVPSSMAVPLQASNDSKRIESYDADIAKLDRNLRDLRSEQAKAHQDRKRAGELQERAEKRIHEAYEAKFVAQQSIIAAQRKQLAEGGRAVAQLRREKTDLEAKLRRERTDRQSDVSRLEKERKQHEEDVVRLNKIVAALVRALPLSSIVDEAVRDVTREREGAIDPQCEASGNVLESFQDDPLSPIL